MNKILLLIITVCIWLPASAQADDAAGRGHSVSGRVLNKGSYPLGGAEVFLVGGTVFVLTDEEGRFSFSGIPAGCYRLRIRTIAFDSVYECTSMYMDECPLKYYKFYFEYPLNYYRAIYNHVQEIDLAGDTDLGTIIPEARMERAYSVAYSARGMKREIYQPSPDRHGPPDPTVRIEPLYIQPLRGPWVSQLNPNQIGTMHVWKDVEIQRIPGQ